MRILVTGGAGYIGSITTRVLLDAGHDCVVLDTLEKGHVEAIDPRAGFVHGSVDDAALLDACLPGCDAVMHLAGYIEVAESVAEPEKYLRNNAIGPLVMLEAMKRHDVRAIVFSSTAAVYGEPVSVPIRENAATKPVNPYGASKLAFEESLEGCRYDHTINSIRFRYFNVAGAWPDGSMGEAHSPETHIVPRVLTALRDGQQRFEVYGDDYPTPDGTCVRDYIHVLDLADGHLAALTHGHGRAGHHTFNLGTGQGHSVLEMLAAFGRACGRELPHEFAPRRPGDVAACWADPHLAEARLGWRATLSLARMCEDSWRWQSMNPNGYEP